jgi:hypothetical protein
MGGRSPAPHLPPDQRAGGTHFSNLSHPAPLFRILFFLSLFLKKNPIPSPGRKKPTGSRLPPIAAGGKHAWPLPPARRPLLRHQMPLLRATSRCRCKFFYCTPRIRLPLAPVTADRRRLPLRRALHATRRSLPPARLQAPPTVRRLVAVRPLIRLPRGSLNSESVAWPMVAVTRTEG